MINAEQNQNYKNYIQIIMLVNRFDTRYWAEISYHKSTMQELDGGTITRQARSSWFESQAVQCLKYIFASAKSCVCLNSHNKMNHVSNINMSQTCHTYNSSIAPNLGCSTFQFS